MKKSFAIFSIALLLLSVGVLALGVLPNTKERETFSLVGEKCFFYNTQSECDTSCGKVKFLRLDGNEQAVFSLDGKKVEIKNFRDDSVNNYVMLKDCALKVLFAKENIKDKKHDQVVLMAVPRQNAELYFDDGETYELVSGYDYDFGSDIPPFEVLEVYKRGAKLKFGTKEVIIEDDKSVEIEDMIFTGIGATGKASEFGRKIYILRIQGKINNLVEMPEDEMPVEENPIGAKFGGDITGKATWTDKEEYIDPITHAKKIRLVPKGIRTRTPQESARWASNQKESLYGGKVSGKVISDTKITKKVYPDGKPITGTGFEEDGRKTVKGSSIHELRDEEVIRREMQGQGITGRAVKNPIGNIKGWFKKILGFLVEF